MHVFCMSTWLDARKMLMALALMPVRLCNMMQFFFSQNLFLFQSRKTNKIDMSCRSFFFSSKKSFLCMCVCFDADILVVNSLLCVVQCIFVICLRSANFVRKILSSAFYSHLFRWIPGFFRWVSEAHQNYQSMNGFCLFFKIHRCDLFFSLSLQVISSVKSSCCCHV